MTRSTAGRQPLPVMNEQVWDDAVAETYDASSADMYAPEILGPSVDFLAGLAGNGRALEFAIGTGRVALPLAARGVDVAGIELSGPMAGRLREKAGGEAIPVVIGDMATATVPGSFRLVYLVYNTITNLLSQDGQVECFRNAARHLEPGGYFVIEVGVPDLQRLPPGENARPFAIGPNHLGFDTYDLVNQRLVSHHFRFEPGCPATTLRSSHRYVWPAELDLMAQIAGLVLHERVADWNRTPFTDGSRSHVSVWQRSPDP